MWQIETQKTLVCIWATIEKQNNKIIKKQKKQVKLIIKIIKQKYSHTQCLGK